MNWFLFIPIMLGTFMLMEGITWLTHRYVMHGFLWFLHEDHHKPAPGIFEKNDAFFLIFAIPSWLSIMFGLQEQRYWLAAIGFGIALYGLAYFLVHDVIIHQRFKWFTRSNNTYVRTIRWAHKMHHKHLDKEDGESFGMLYVARKYWEKVVADKKRNADNFSCCNRYRLFNSISYRSFYGPDTYTLIILSRIFEFPLHILFYPGCSTCRALCFKL
jgi:beta-carotene 3-hydroxylase